MGSWHLGIRLQLEFKDVDLVSHEYLLKPAQSQEVRIRVRDFRVPVLRLSLWVAGF